MKTADEKARELIRARQISGIPISRQTLTRAITQARREGAEDMRERVADYVELMSSDVQGAIFLHESVRNLPLPGDE